jgi:hypothetical protein
MDFGKKGCPAQTAPAPGHPILRVILTAVSNVVKNAGADSELIILNPLSVCQYVPLYAKTLFPLRDIYKFSHPYLQT